jgi:hypothetical protein
MIPFMRPVVVANPVADDLAFASRAEEIRALPQLLSVELTAPSGLDLVNVGDAEPQAQHRNKPWFKPNSDGVGNRGVYAWNPLTAPSGAWENLSPVDAEALLEKIKDAEEVANAAALSAQAAKADADRSKEFATAAQAEADAASTNAGLAEDKADGAAAVYGGIVYGSVAGVSIIATVGAWWSSWYNFTPPFDAGEDLVGFITLSADSHPNIPFRYGIEVTSDATNLKVRVVGYNIFATDAPRVVSAMWMVKGTPL